MSADSGTPKPDHGGANLNVHPLVAKRLGDDGEPKPTASLVGYVGPSKKADHVRLYTGLDFQTYYEIPRSAVVDSQPLDSEDENSGSHVVVNPDATIELVQVTKQSGTAAYLTGGISGTYLSAQTEIPIIHPTTTIFTRHSLFYVCVTNHVTVCNHTLIPILCRGIPGGTEGEEAAVASPNFAPVHTGIQNCTIAACHVHPQRETGAAANVAGFPNSVFCASYNIPCISKWITCPTQYPCPKADRVAEAQAAFPPHPSFFECTRPVHICSAPGFCGTNHHQLC